jgi:hypothetical protein
VRRLARVGCAVWIGVVAWAVDRVLIGEPGALARFLEAVDARWSARG